MEEKKNYLDIDKFERIVNPGKKRITKIEILSHQEHKLDNVIYDRIEYDVSTSRDKSIILYTELNYERPSEDDYLTLYLRAKNGPISLKGDCSNLFMFFTNLDSIKGLENLDTSEVTSMRNLFYNCTSLKQLNLSSWDTGDVEDVSSMFEDCTNLLSLNLKGWDTRNIKNFSYMLRNCVRLSSLNLSTFDLSSAKKVERMLEWCNNLRELKLGNFNVNDKELAESIFDRCLGVNKVTLNFNNPYVEDILTQRGNIDITRNYEDNWSKRLQELFQECDTPEKLEELRKTLEIIQSILPNPEQTEEEQNLVK